MTVYAKPPRPVVSMRRCSQAEEKDAFFQSSGKPFRMRSQRATCDAKLCIRLLRAAGRQAAAGFSLLASTGALKKILPTETSHMLKSHTEDLTNLQHAMLPNIARTDHQPTQPFVSSNPFYQACARAFQCSSKCRLGIADSRFDDAQAAFEPQTLRTRRCLAYQKPPVQIPRDVLERRRTRAAPQPRFFSFTTAFSPHI